MELDLEQDDNQIHCDNKQTVRLIQLDNPIVKTNIRHINISDLWLRQEHKRGNIKIQWTDSNKMKADGFTKPLPKGKFQRIHKTFRDGGRVSSYAR